jgi:hypothetical protein
MDSDCRAYLAHAERDKADLDGAIVYCASLSGRRTVLIGTHFLLGMAIEKKGDKAGATEAFRQAAGLAAGWWSEATPCSRFLRGIDEDQCPQSTQ